MRRSVTVDGLPQNMEFQENVACVLSPQRSAILLSRWLNILKQGIFP